MRPYYRKNAAKLKKKPFGFYKMVKGKIEQDFGIPYVHPAMEKQDTAERLRMGPVAGTMKFVEIMFA